MFETVKHVLFQLLDALAINGWMWLYHVVVFAFLFAVLSKVLWGPLQKRLRDREEEIESAEREITVRREEAERLAKEYEDRMKEIEDQAYQKVQAAITRGIDEKNKLIAEAQERAETELANAREQIRKEKLEALESLRTEMAAMSADLVSRITSGELSIASSDCEPVVDDLVTQQFGEDRS